MGRVWQSKKYTLFIVSLIVVAFVIHHSPYTGKAVNNADKPSSLKQQAQMGDTSVSPPPSTSNLVTNTPTTNVYPQKQITVYVEIDASVDNAGKGTITDYSYACAESTDPLLQTFEQVLRSFGVPQPQGLPTSVMLKSGTAPIRWSFLTPFSTTSTTQKKISDQDPKIAKGVAFVKMLGNCNEITTQKMSLLPSQQSLPLEGKATPLFAPAPPNPTGTCETLKAATTSPSADYIFIVDKGWENFVAGSQYWGDPIQKEEVNKVFPYYTRRLLDIPPFNDYKESLNFYLYRSNQNYQHCESVCNFGSILSEVINSCGLMNHKNIKLSVHHGVDEQTRNSFFGKAYYNSPYSEVLVGEYTKLLIYYALSNGVPLNPSFLKLLREEEFLLLPEVIIHEFGHTYGLDHTDCQDRSVLQNSPNNICFTDAPTCLSITKDECNTIIRATAQQDTTHVVTSTSKPSNPDHYMSPTISTVNPAVPATSYQEVGKIFVSTIHENVLKNWFGLKKSPPYCDNSLVEDFEDTDHENILFDYDRDRLGVASCADLYGLFDDMEHQIPLTTTSSNFMNLYLTYESLLYPSRHVPFDIGIITRDKKTCRLQFTCANKVTAAVQGGMPIYTQHSNYLLFNEGFDPLLGFLPTSTQTDCTKVDYRFQPNKQYTVFDAREPRTSNFNGRDTCDIFNNFEATAPFFPDEDKRTLFAYQSDSGALKTLTTGMLDQNNNINQRTTLFLPASKGKLLRLQYVEFDPRDWTHNYDPTNMPLTSFASFTHPLAFVAVFENGVEVYRFKQNSQEGIDPTPLHSVQVSGTITDVVDVSFNKQSQNIVITHLVTKTTGSVVEQIVIPTKGTKTTVSPQILLSNIVAHSLPFASPGVSPDKKAFVSVRDSPSQPGLLFVQQSPSAGPLSRTLAPDERIFSRTVLAKTKVETDALGRYIFLTVEPETSSSSPISLHRYTLTATGLIDRSYPITDLPNAATVYQTPSTAQLQSAATREGPVFAVPIYQDQFIVLIDQQNKQVQLNAFIPSSTLSNTPYYDLDAFHKTLYSSANPNAPINTDSDNLVLTSTASGYPLLHNVVLYQEVKGQMVQNILESATNTKTTFSHFELFTTSVNIPQQTKKQLLCSVENTGFLSNINKRVLDSDYGDRVLVGAGTIASSSPLTLELHSLGGTCYGCFGNTLIGTVTLPNGLQVFDAEIDRNKVFAQNAAFIIGRDSTNAIVGYAVDFDAGTFTRVMLPSNALMLGDEKVYSILYGPSGSPINFQSCPLLNCQTPATAFSIPSTPSGIIKNRYSTDGIIVIDWEEYGSGSRKTYIYDGILHTFPKKLLYVTMKNGDIYYVYDDNALLTGQSATVLEVLRRSGNNLISVSKQNLNTPILSTETVRGILESNSQQLLVVEKSSPSEIEIRGDTALYSPSVCLQQSAGYEIADLSSSSETLFSLYFPYLSGGQTQVFTAQAP